MKEEEEEFSLLIQSTFPSLRDLKNLTSAQKKKFFSVCQNRFNKILK
jgi:hypothetical protein